MMRTPIQQPQHKKAFDWHALIGFVLIWFLFAYIYDSYVQRQHPVEKISYSGFKQAVEQNKVARVTFQGPQVQGVFKSDKAQSSEQNRSAGSQPNQDQVPDGPYGQLGDRFSTYLPQVQDPQLMPLLERQKVTIFAKNPDPGWLWRVLISMLPWILIIGFFVYSSKKVQERMGGQGGGIFGFGKSKAKRFRQTDSDVTFNDVAGLENAKKELQEIVAFLQDPSRFTALGGELPHGLLLVGPPGIGKTLMARATAGEAEVPFFSISGSEFIEMFVGVGASRVRDMFERAK